MPNAADVVNEWHHALSVVGIAADYDTTSTRANYGGSNCGEEDFPTPDAVRVNSSSGNSNSSSSAAVTGQIKKTADQTGRGGGGRGGRGGGRRGG